MSQFKIVITREITHWVARCTGQHFDLVQRGLTRITALRALLNLMEMSLEIHTEGDKVRELFRYNNAMLEQVINGKVAGYEDMVISDHR